MKKFIKVLTGFTVIMIAYIILLLYISGLQSDYKVIFTTEQENYEFVENDNGHSIGVKVKNKANRRLSSVDNFFVSYHLYDLDGNVISEDNMRTELPKALFTGDSVDIDVHLTHLAPGEYIIGFDMVQEYVEWFSAYEDIEKKVKVTIR